MSGDENRVIDNNKKIHDINLVNEEIAQDINPSLYKVDIAESIMNNDCASHKTLLKMVIGIILVITLTTIITILILNRIILSIRSV